MITVQKSNRGVIITTAVVTLIIVIILVIANLVMFFTNKGLYQPYKPPPKPAKAIAPNGNINDPNSSQELLTFNAPILKAISGNLQGYNAPAAKTDPTQWGYYSTP
jgi:hypothetical protein